MFLSINCLPLGEYGDGIFPAYSVQSSLLRQIFLPSVSRWESAEEKSVAVYFLCSLK